MKACKPNVWRRLSVLVTFFYGIMAVCAGGFVVFVIFTILTERKRMECVLKTVRNLGTQRKNLVGSSVWIKINV